MRKHPLLPPLLFISLLSLLFSYENGISFPRQARDTHKEGRVCLFFFPRREVAFLDWSGFESMERFYAVFDAHIAQQQ
eukprot:COSAG06_NODE_3413_length_5380_cov_4.609354_9_plen_78_part_00